LPQKTAIVTQGNQQGFCLGLSVDLDLRSIWGHIQTGKKAMTRLLGHRPAGNQK
jgi:hypothetical protein